jgi:CBS domain-containing protein
VKVIDVMHKGVDWVSPTTPVTELAKLMRGHDVGCIGLASNNFDAGRTTARDVMTEGIHCCREDDDLAKAMHHMEKLQLRRLPVINKSKRMVGIISLGDVSHSASGDLLSECVRSVSAHH